MVFSVTSSYVWGEGKGGERERGREGCTKRSVTGTLHTTGTLE